MNKKVCLRKALVLALIFLFVGAGIAPSINANVSKEEELVEYTAEVCGLNGGKRTVQLSKEEAEEVEQLLKDIKVRLDNVDTREEAVDIFNEAVVELNKYDLLGGLSIEQAQKLIIEDYPADNIQRILSNGLTDSENIFCILYATASFYGRNRLFFPVGLISILGLIPLTLGFLGNMIFQGIGLDKLGEVIFAFSILFGVYPSLLNPLRFMNIIFSNLAWDVTSFGLKGLVYSKDAYLFLGYTGLMLLSPGEVHFLGFCLWFD